MWEKSVELWSNFVLVWELSNRQLCKVKSMNSMMYYGAALWLPIPIASWSWSPVEPLFPSLSTVPICIIFPDSHLDHGPHLRHGRWSPFVIVDNNTTIFRIDILIPENLIN